MAAVALHEREGESRWMTKNGDWIRALRIAAVALPCTLGVALWAPAATAQEAGLESVKPTSSADAYYERGARALRRGPNNDPGNRLAQPARNAFARSLIED